MVIQIKIIKMCYNNIVVIEMWFLIVIIIIIIVCYSYVTHNSLIYLNQKTDKEFLELDIFFKRRISLLPNVINIFNSYNLEKDTLNKITFLLKDNYDNLTVKDKIDLNMQLNDLIDRLWEIADANIILKQNPVFLNVIKQFNLSEEEIVANKKSYNDFVRKYNRKVNRFPSKIIAMFLKLSPKYSYNVDEGTRRVIKTDSPYHEAIKLEDKEEEDDEFF